MTSGGVPSETELAFTLPNGRAHVESHPLFLGTNPTSHQLISTYYDTPARILEQSGWTVRLRSQGDQCIQTVKGPPVAVTRPEWNSELDPSTEGLDFDRLKATPVWPIIDGKATLLRPLFETDIVRATRNLQYENARIEAVIDEGVVRCFYNESHRVGIYDLELEIKDGDAGAMFRLAIELVFDTGIIMEPASKAERGYRLINGGPPNVHKHGDVALLKGTPTIIGFRHILAEVLTHLRQNLHAARAGQPNGIHQTRVGLRRLRALLALFGDILHRETVRNFDAELRYFSTVFGHARDWDVFITDTLAAASQAMPHAHWLNLLGYTARNRQAVSHEAVVREVNGVRFNSLILSLMGWAEDYPSTTAPRRVYQRPIDEVMPGLLTATADNVDKRRRRLDGKPESLHALRKAMKKLRYAVEFAESLYPENAVQTFLRPCKDAQDVLGGLNDIETTRHLIDTLTVSYPAVTPAIREFSMWLRQRERNVAQPMSKLLRQLRPFW
jgi:inorganic triphosphatase YgiF